VDKNVIKNFKV